MGALLRALAPAVAAVAVLAGCSGSTSASTAPAAPASAPASAPGRLSRPDGETKAQLIKCLEKHGVKLPSRRGAGPPPGGLPGKLKKALEACGFTPPSGVSG
jgi:hypothetical protein